MILAKNYAMRTKEMRTSCSCDRAGGCNATYSPPNVLDADRLLPVASRTTYRPIEAAVSVKLKIPLGRLCCADGDFIWPTFQQTDDDSTSTSTLNPRDIDYDVICSFSRAFVPALHSNSTRRADKLARSIAQSRDLECWPQYVAHSCCITEHFFMSFSGGSQDVILKSDFRAYLHILHIYNANNNSNDKHFRIWSLNIYNNLYQSCSL